MSNKVYKYVGPGNLDKVFGSNDHVTLKCSYPKDFNDPYELFLTINFGARPDALAFYADAVGDLPQLPTTCFSLSPAVVPMWAHYAENLQGFAIEFKEELLSQHFPDSGFDDVDYRDTPSEDLTDLLYRAYEMAKPRYLYLLRKGVFSAAYYTKATCWGYEHERRMIVRQSEIRPAGDLMLLDVPSNCVTALICGPRATAETVLAVRNQASKLGCAYFELKIGRSTPVPYFVSSDSIPCVFNGNEIEPSARFCGSCREPLVADSDQCAWCQIEDSHKHEAAARNTYRMLDHHGLLEEYVAGMDEIDRGARES